jgi:cytoskeletal protein RodZ
MWPFNRRQKQQTGVPQEIQEYYQTERRERVGLAWLIALATLVVTVLIALGLFYGGRWAYRSVFKKDNKPTTAVVENNDKQSATTNENAPNTGTSSTSTSQPSPAPSSNTATNPATTTTPQATGTTAGRNNGLPNTGPGDVIAIFVVTAIAGTITHRLVTARRYPL